jgi:hydrogenase expression/formation protein HypC
MYKPMCLAVPGKIISVIETAPDRRVGKVDFSGIAKEVSLDFVPDAQVGDYVIVHVGFALSKVDEAEALQVFQYLKEMGELLELDEAKKDHPTSPVP